MASKKAQAPAQGSSKRIYILLAILAIVFYVFLAKYSGVNLPGGSFLVSIFDTVFFVSFLGFLNFFYESGYNHVTILATGSMTAIIFAIILFTICFLALKFKVGAKFSLLFVLGLVSSVLLLISSLLGKLLPNLVDYINNFGKISIGIIGLLLAMQFIGAIGISGIAGLFQKDSNKFAEFIKLFGIFFGILIFSYSIGFIAEPARALSVLPGLQWLDAVAVFLEGLRSTFWGWFWFILIGGGLVFILQKIGIWSYLLQMGKNLVSNIPQPSWTRKPKLKLKTSATPAAPSGTPASP